LKIAMFLMVLLAISAAAVLTVSIASNVSSRLPTSQMNAALFDVVPNDEEPNGDPVGGGGRGPGTPT